MCGKAERGYVRTGNMIRSPYRLLSPAHRCSACRRLTNGFRNVLLVENLVPSPQGNRVTAEAASNDATSVTAIIINNDVNSPRLDD